MPGALENLVSILRQFPTKATAAAKFSEIIEHFRESDPGFAQSGFYVNCMLELANFYFLAAQFKSALKCYDSLKLSYDQLGNTPFYQYGVLYLNKGLCHLYSANYASAEENFKRTLLCNEDVVGDRTHQKLKSLAYQNLGCLYEIKGRLGDALESYEKAFKIWY